MPRFCDNSLVLQYLLNFAIIFTYFTVKSGVICNNRFIITFYNNRLQRFGTRKVAKLGYNHWMKFVRNFKFLK